jgi:prepilin-type processing-associated H-X9-DG protein
LDKVPRDAAFFLSARLADLWGSDVTKEARQVLAKENPDALKEIRKAIGAAPEEIERFTVFVSDIRPTGPSQPLFLITTVKPYDKAKLLETVVPKAKEEKRKDKVLYTAENGQAVSLINDQVYLVGPVDTVRSFLDDSPKKTGPQDAALRLAADKHAAVFGLNPVLLAQILEGMLPPQLDPYKALLKTQTASLVLDVGEESRADLRLTFAKEAEAKEGAKALQMAFDRGRDFLAKGIKELSKKPEGVANYLKMLRDLETSLKTTPIEQKGSEVRVAARVKSAVPVLSAALIEGVQKTRESATRIKSMNNLKQIGLAMHNYHDTNGKFPPAAIFDKDGKPLLSWRVLILPYIEQDNLYKEFHLDEPWDSEHNKKLLAKIPPVYGPLDEKGPKGTDTYYQAFIGKSAFFEGKKGLTFADFTDGTSNTIMIVEAAKPVPWSKPEDIPFDAGKLVPKVGGLFPNGFNAAFCDGSVRFFSKKIPEDILRALITRNGGEVIDYDKIP